MVLPDGVITGVAGFELTVTVVVSPKILYVTFFCCDSAIFVCTEVGKKIILLSVQKVIFL